jgi:hypothetical protein
VAVRGLTGSIRQAARNAYTTQTVMIIASRKATSEKKKTGRPFELR